MPTAEHTLTLDPALRASAMRHGAIALAVIAILAGLLAWHFELGRSYALRALAAMTLAVIGVFHLLPAHAPYHELGPGNRVTLARLGVIALLAGFVGEPVTPTIAWGLVLIATVAAVLDIFDGRLARTTGMASRFGARFDMETDAAMVGVLGLLVWQLDKTGWWFLIGGALRYLFLAAAIVWPWLDHPLPPSVRRQTCCVVQIVVSIVAIAPIIRPPLSQVLTAVALVLLAGSFALDVRWLERSRRTTTDRGESGE
jgi:phosphatidylglycerophosphate synthase